MNEYEVVLYRFLNSELVMLAETLRLGAEDDSRLIAA